MLKDGRIKTIFYKTDSYHQMTSADNVSFHAQNDTNELMFGLQLFVAQLSEWSLPNSDNLSLNKAIGRFY